MTTYEVEQKFPLADPQAFHARLEELGPHLFEVVEQVDSYYAHPARDFAVTDEALRLRREGPHNRATYKGPKLDATTKTRAEIELPLGDGGLVAEQFSQLLWALGFRHVADVRKLRRLTRIKWEGELVELAIDQVEQVGTFVELELQADATGVEAARARLASLARWLGLQASERRSYLELLQSAPGDMRQAAD